MFSPACCLLAALPGVSFPTSALLSPILKTHHLHVRRALRLAQCLPLCLYKPLADYLSNTSFFLFLRLLLYLTLSALKAGTFL